MGRFFGVLTICPSFLHNLLPLPPSAFPPELADGGAVDILTPRLVYCAVQAAGLLFALHRLNGMGLLPTRAADWAAGLPPARAVQPAGGAMLL